MSPDSTPRDGTTWRSTGSASKRLSALPIAGLTSTRPPTTSAWTSARRSARQPPIDNPPTMTWSQRSASPSSARSTAAYQSGQRVVLSSCQVVPCPGSSGTSTVKPAPARCCAHGRIEAGEPVRPWHSNTPLVPPAWLYGSAPRTVCTARPSAPDRVVSGIVARPAVSRGTGSGRVVFARVLLVPEAGDSGTRAAAGVPAVGRGPRTHSGPRSGHRGEQSPFLLRLAVHAARRAAACHVPRKDRLLHRAGDQGLVQAGLLPRRRAGSDRPIGRPGQRGCDLGRTARAAPWRPARYLPRGHPLSGRTPLSGEDRRRPDGPGGQGTRDPGGDDRHRQDAAAGPVDSQDHETGPAVRDTAELRPLRGHGERPIRPSVGDRRDRLRPDGVVRAGVRGHLRPARKGRHRRRQEEGQGWRALAV